MQTITTKKLHNFIVVGSERKTIFTLCSVLDSGRFTKHTKNKSLL